MKKIDSIYVIGNRKDIYFLRLCIASIRYWNDYTPVFIIKDLSKGNFNTRELEEKFNARVLPTNISALGYFAKLYPLIEKKEERLLILDADIVWMSDLVPQLEKTEEDIVADGYSPAEPAAEKLRWYFKEPAFSENFPDYQYPGYFFNVGQMMINTCVFSRDEFLQLVNWQENPSAKIGNAFFYEQGILNYLAAKKVKEGTATYCNINFHTWGWDHKIDSLQLSALKNKTGYPFLIHWYGVKNGLTSFLPGSRFLKYYEAFYFSRISGGKSKMIFERLKRTFQHPGKFMYGLLKKIYYLFMPKKPANGS